MLVIFESGCDGGGKRKFPVETGWCYFKHDGGPGTPNGRLRHVPSAALLLPW